MKKTILLLATILLQTQSYSQQYVWTQKTSLPALARSAGVSFSIGNKAYFGTGVVFTNGNATTYKDFWEFDPASNVRTQKADAGTAGRWGASAFTIGNFGYVGTGWSPAPLNDFLKYDATLNTWTAVASLPSQARYHAFTFSIGNTGYFGTGYSSGTYSDFWAYDPTANSWSQKASFGGGGRENAVAFAINGYGYAGMGWNNISKNDFWRYDPNADSWVQMTNFPGNAGYAGAAFELNGKGYAGIYFDDVTYYNNWWEFDPINNAWNVATTFPGIARANSAFCSVNGKGYIGTGDANHPNFIFYNDWWEFSLSTNISYNQQLVSLHISPNPASHFININYSFKNNVDVFLYDTNGKLVLTHCLSGKNPKVDIKNILKGNYLLKINTDEKVLTAKFQKN